MPIRAKRLLRTTLIILLIASLAYGLGWSKILAVDSIEIFGTNQKALVLTQLNAGESKIRIGEPLARINPRCESNLIEDLEWISSAKVSRNWWSGKVSIQINERRPVAVFKENSGANGPRYLASNGVEFSSPIRFNNLAEIALGKSSHGDRRVIANFVSHLPSNLLGSLLALEVSSTKEVKMEMNHNKHSVMINWGAGNSSADIAVKSKVLEGLLGLPENKKIAEVDISIANSPIVR